MNDPKPLIANLEAPKPSVGRIVHYTLTEADAAALFTNAGDAFINPVREGSVLPAVVTAVFGDNPQGTANLRVLADGPADLWATSRYRSDSGEPEPGRWNWPPRV